MQHNMRFIPPHPALAHTTDMCEAALEYARRGWRVLPLHGMTTGEQCTCGDIKCTRIGQHPVYEDGIREATTNVQIIRQWWSVPKQWNIGIATGDGLIVINIDPHQEDLLEQFINFFALPETMTVETEEGYKQLYFTYNAALLLQHTVNKFGRGISSLGEGHYVIAPPSQQKQGFTVHVTSSAPPAPLPSVMLPALLSSALPMRSWQRHGSKPSSAARALANVLVQKSAQKKNPPPKEETEKEEVSAMTQSEQPLSNSHLISLDVLLNMQTAERDWLIPHILPIGVTLLTGKELAGKSWLALEIALAITMERELFGKRPMQAGGALYLGLEIGMRNMQERIRLILQGQPAPKNAHWAGHWPQLAQGGMADLEEWVEYHPDTRLIVIDPLALVQPLPGKKKQDATFMTPLKLLAARYHLSILLVRTADELTSMSELAAMAGSAMILKRNIDQRQATLHILGQDMMTQEYTYSFYE